MHKMMACLILAIFLHATATVSPAAAQRTVRIGCFVPLSGPVLQPGLRMQEGLRMAVDDALRASPAFAAAVRVEVKCDDNQARPDESAAIAKRIVEDRDVLIAIGGFGSAEVMAAAPVFTEGKTPFISPTSLHPDLTKVSPWVFRMNMNPVSAQAANARYAWDLGKRSAAIVALANDYGRTNAELYKRDFEALGGKVVATELVRPDLTDFRPILTELRRQKPDIVHLILFPPVGAPLLRQARQTGFDVDIQLDYPLWTADTIRLAGDTADGRYLVFLVDPASFASVLDWQRAYQAQHNVVPDGFSVNYYNAGSMVMSLMIKIGPQVTRESLKDAIGDLRQFKAMTGTLTNDATSREWTFPTARGIIRGGKFELNERLN